MKFTKGLWTHEKFMDVAIEVVKVSYMNHKKAKLKIWWWNRGWVGKPFKPFTDKTDRLVITDFTGWKKIYGLERIIDEI